MRWSIETRHFDTSNWYISSQFIFKINELLLFLGKKKIVQPKLCSPVSPDVASPNKEEFVHYSKDKITQNSCIFVNWTLKQEIFVCCFPLSSLVVYCRYCNLNVLFLHDSSQCYKQSTTLVQPLVVVRSRRIFKSPFSAMTEMTHVSWTRFRCFAKT